MQRTQQFMRLGLPLTVTFTHATRQPVGSNGCDPLPEKVGDPPCTEFNPNWTIKKKAKYLLKFIYAQGQSTTFTAPAFTKSYSTHFYKHMPK
jgi:hypothetical protein